MDLTFPSSVVSWTETERRAWTPPDNLSTSEWADRHRILHPLTSAEPGKWNTDRTPYLREIMDAFSDPSVEQLTVMASTQVGKTESLLNMLGYAISEDPGAALLVLPREEDAVQIGQRRIRPMIDSSPELAKHLSESKSDNKLKEVRFSRSMLYLAGSNSPADLASRPVRYALADEVDKFPAFSGREASPVDLMVERTRTFWNRKIVLTSTPTTRNGYIFQQYERSDRRQYFVPCPHCEELQTLEFSQVKWPEDERDPAKIRQERLAWYECRHCEERINDLDKPEMLNRGKWQAEGETTSHRGYRIHSLYSPWLTFSEVAAKFLEANAMGVASLMNFVNSWLGWIFEEESEKVEAEDLAGRTKTYKRSTVPQGVKVITAGVDVQKDHLYYVIRGWGLNEESWLIECGRLDAGLEAMTDVLIRRQFGPHRVRMVCIDSGYRTDEIYRYCRNFPEVARPIKGQRTLSGVPIKSSKIDRNVKGDPFKKSVRLFLLDTGHFKDKVTRMMTAQDGEHGAWHLHDDIPPEYLRQVTSEHKVFVRNKRTGATKTEWAKKPGVAANHWWDCEVYATAAADMVAVYALTEESTGNQQPEPTPQQGWVSRKGKGWLSNG